MYMQNDIVADTFKGPTFKALRVDPTARRAEVEKVIDLATAALPKAIMRKLGALSFSATSSDEEWSSFGEIRSESMGRSGMEFRFPMPARNTGQQNLEQLTCEVVRAATVIAKADAKLKKYGAIVRSTAEETIAPATGGIAPMRLVAVGITHELSGLAMSTTVDVEMLGCDLTVGIERCTSHDFDELEKALAQLVASHMERRKAFAQSRVLNVSGWIDGAACLIAHAADAELTDIIERLRTAPEVEFQFGGDEGRDFTGGMYWVDGTIKGFVEPRTIDTRYRLKTNELMIAAANLPATIVATLIGQRLRNVVDVEFIPHSALIIDVREKDDYLYLDLEIGKVTIEDALNAP